MHKVQDDNLVMSLVETALATPPDEREAYIEKACGQDTELFASVWTYVQWEQRMNGFLLEPLYPAFTVEHPFEPDQVLDSRFRIVREVAQGGMGIVYEAVDEKLERRIALKCAKTGFGKRLPPEARNASDIGHPNVCKIFEIHTASTQQGDIDFLTMEFLEGETLADRLHRGPLPDEEARVIALQLCAGLAAAHRKQVIHGDLKSNNVIITREPAGDVRAVITDFGLARRPEALQSAIQSGELRGTPDYMAPELWKGEKASVASDIYALGVILRELARDTKAPQAKWNRVIQRCLDDDPSRRFSNADEIARALEPRTRRWFMATAAATVLAVASGLATYELTTAPEENVELAVLPFTAVADTAGIADHLFRDVAGQLTRVKSNARTSLTVISINKTLRRKVDTPQKARAALGATHVLSGTLQRDTDKLVLQAYVTDTRSLVNVKQWKAVYGVGDIRYAPLALAGVVTGAFRLPAASETATVSAAARQDYLSGVHYLRWNSKVDIALPLLGRAVATDRDSPLTHAAMAEGYWWKYVVTRERAWRDRTAEELRQAEMRNPDLAEVHRISGLLKADAGSYEQAEAEYMRAIELDPNHSDAYRRLGIAYDGSNDREKALVAYRRAVELDPEYYRNHQALGAFYKERGQYREALKSFQKTVQLAPGEHAGHYALATVHIALGQFVDAERELRLALDLGETAVVLNALGASLTYQSRDQEAIPYITRALSLYPERYLWWLNLGTAYRRLNIITDAERAYRRAFELAEAEMANNPRNGYARACLAYVAAWLGDRRRAESEIAQALQFSSTDNDTRRMAVKTYEALRKRDDSLAVLAASPPDVIADVSRYPDLADLRADRRFIKLLAAHEETHAH